MSSGLTTKEIIMISKHRTSIGLHSFTRRLYRDVPDMFDELKKLFFRIQKKLNKLNPDKVNAELLKEKSELSLMSTGEQEEVRIIEEQEPIPKSIEEVLKKNPNAPTWFVWRPCDDMDGSATAIFLKRKRKFNLKYHMGDFASMKENYPTDHDFDLFFNILQFCFDNYLEPNSIIRTAIDNENSSIRVINFCFKLTFINSILFQ
jgi:hypothetical protein